MKKIFLVLSAASMMIIQSCSKDPQTCPKGSVWSPMANDCVPDPGAVQVVTNGQTTTDHTTTTTTTTSTTLGASPTTTTLPEED